MTNGKGERFFPGMGAAALAAALSLAACSNTTRADVPVAEGRSGSPTDTGTFPNLNIPPKAAATQFTNEERDAKLAELRAKEQAQNPGATAAESAEARRKRLQLSQDEQANTLKVIEGQ